MAESWESEWHVVYERELLVGEREVIGAEEIGGVCATVSEVVEDSDCVL